MDQANECNPAGKGGQYHNNDITEAGKVQHCYQNNTVFSNGFIRRVASALPSMAKQLGEDVDPQWREISLKLDPLPMVVTSGTEKMPWDPPRKVIVLAGNYSEITYPPGPTKPNCSWVQCGTRQCNNPCWAQVAGDGMMDVMAWPVFPGEAISLASPEGLKQAVRDTLQLSAEWQQSNSFCSIFSQAARVGMPL